MVLPGGVVLSGHGFDLSAGQAFPFTKAAFAKTAIADHRQSQHICKGVSGLLRAKQIAGQYHHAPAGCRSFLILVNIGTFRGIRSGLRDGFGMRGQTVYLGPVIA